MVAAENAMVSYAFFPTTKDSLYSSLPELKKMSLLLMSVLGNRIQRGDPNSLVCSRGELNNQDA
jgi:hypothetical protein